MSLTERKLSGLDAPALTRDGQALAACRLAKESEERGRYDEAREALSDFWPGAGSPPEIGGLGARSAAELFLRAGTLTGWLGSSRQLTEAQESAKNLLSEAQARFESLGDARKSAESLIELAYCYWRQGATGEARDLLAEGRARLAPGDDDLRAVACLRAALVEESETRFHDALQILNEAAPLFGEGASDALKGKYHNELAAVLWFLGGAERREDYTDRAFVEYAAASFHFERAGHASYRAAVENNLGCLFLTAGRHAEAHQHLDCARRLFTRLKDGAHAAQVDETRARVLLAEGRADEAEQSARASARALERGDEHALLAEALTTHGVALARLGRHDEARATLRRAAHVAEGAGNLEGAGLAELTLLEELHGWLTPRESRELYASADQLLARTQSQQTLSRLRAAALKLVTSDNDARPAEVQAAAENAPENFAGGAGRAAAGRANSDAAAGGETPAAGPGAAGTDFSDPWADFSFRDEVKRFEEDLIERALRDAGGSVSRAARLLGFPHHESLNWRLKNRNKSLLAARTPARQRRRSIITKRG